MNIGFDFDDTIYQTSLVMDTAYIKWCNFVGRFPIIHPEFYKTEERYEISNNIAELFWDQADKFNPEFLVPKAITWLKKMQAAGDDLFCITARTDYDTVANELIKININQCLSAVGLENVHIVVDTTNKEFVCDDYKVEIFFDDNYSIIKNFETSNCYGILIDQPYNKKIYTSSRIGRIDPAWNDISKLEKDIRVLRYIRP